MQYEKMAACADMTLTNAIEDMAKEEHITIDEARSRLLESKTYECLYDFDTGMWMEGPDYLRDTYKRLEHNGKAREI